MTIFERLGLRVTHPQKAYNAGVDAVRDALSEKNIDPEMFRGLAEALNKAKDKNPYKAP